MWGYQETASCIYSLASSITIRVDRSRGPPGCTGFRIAGVNYPALKRAGLPASVPGLQAVPDLFSQIASEVLIARPQMILIAHHTHRPFPRFQGGISCTAPHPHQVLIV